MEQLFHGRIQVVSNIYLFKILERKSIVAKPVIKVLCCSPPEISVQTIVAPMARPKHNQLAFAFSNGFWTIVYLIIIAITMNKSDVIIAKIIIYLL